MASSSELRRIKDTYVAYRGTAVAAKTAVEKTKTTFSSLQTGLASAYVLDGVIGDENHLETLKQDVSSVVGKLDGLLNHFDEEIARLDSEIREAEAREERERQAAERRRRAARAAALAAQEEEM